MQASRRQFPLVAGLMAAAFCVATAVAQPYPSKPIRFVLSVGTGGVGDTTNRLFAQHMSRSMGQQIVVDNRPSGGGTAAAMAVIDANPDGYTLLQAGNGVAVSTALYKKLPFSILKDFRQVSSVASFQLVILATPASGHASLADLIAFAKQRPGKLDIGTPRVGSTQYLAAELFKSMAGIQAQVVPFKSNTLLITAMRGNELPVAFELLGPALSYIRNKSLRALAVGSAERFAGLPDVPTIAESGIRGYDVSSWTGISVPAKTPSAIVERLAREVARAAALPEVRQPLQDIGIEARASTPEETRKRMVADIARWTGVIERAKIPRQ